MDRKEAIRLLKKVHFGAPLKKYKEACDFAISILEQGLCDDCVSRKEDVETINSLKSVHPKINIGHVIVDEDGNQKCSECSSSECWGNYCMNCGAKMIEPQESEDNKEMNEQMVFPETFEKFVKEYGFKDDKEVYTNGSDLIPIFRVKQWLEHDNKLCTIETDTAYECGKYANKWIPVSERLPNHPENNDYYIVTIQCEHYDSWDDYVTGFAEWTEHGWNVLSCYIGQIKVVAWMPLPEPHEAVSEGRNE